MSLVKAPIVSIIVPCYMQAQYLSEALESVLNQDFTNWECIIINDGSPDETDTVANKWLKKDARFKYKKIKNKGVSNARNVGISLSKGKYILPLDSDDIMSTNYVRELLNAIDKNKNIKVVYGSLSKFGFKNGLCELSNFNFEYLIFSNMIHCSGLYRKEDFETTGGYDTGMKEGYEDWEFWINLLKKGGKGKRVDTACLYYRSKQESRATKIDLKKRYRLIAYIYNKHSELYQSYCDDYSKKINLNFVYSFYLSAKMYNESNILKMKTYFNFKLKSELKKYSFIKRKRILFYWFKANKFNLSLIDVLIK